MAPCPKWCSLVVLMFVFVCGVRTQTCDVTALLSTLGINTNLPPQSTESPFLLTVSPAKYVSSSYTGRFTVRISKALDSLAFPSTIKGIFLQVKNQGENSIPVGSWLSTSVSNDYMLQTCSNTGDTIIQVNSSSKDLPVEFEWISPEQSSFLAYADIVYSDDRYWVGHTANIVNEAPEFQHGGCASNPCVHGACWTSVNSGYICICDSAYDGDNCANFKLNANPCDLVVCENGGTCFQGLVSGSVICVCTSGFTGDRCQTQDFCASGPCLNGGTCSNNLVLNTFSCQCPSGFEGNQCQTSVPNPCEPNPCLNGGTCSAQDGSSTCDCPPGYTGDTCNTMVPNPCEPNPCLNGGTCSAQDGTSTCDCPPGYTGDTCNTMVPPMNPCDPNPCQNGGSCTNTGTSSFACTCPPTHQGATCEEVANPCDPNPCENAGTCSIDDDGFACNCPSGFSGDTCNRRECIEGTTCQNGGRCSTSPNKICDCATSFVGEFCEGNSPCSPDPCANGATCLYRGTTIMCVCQTGYIGNRCQESTGDNDTNIQDMPLEIWWIILLALVGLLLVIIIISILCVVCRSSSEDDNQHMVGNRKPYP